MLFLFTYLIHQVSGADALLIDGNLGPSVILQPFVQQVKGRAGAVVGVIQQADQLLCAENVFIPV